MERNALQGDRVPGLEATLGVCGYTKVNIDPVLSVYHGENGRMCYVCQGGTRVMVVAPGRPNGISETAAVTLNQWPCCDATLSADGRYISLVYKNRHTMKVFDMYRHEMMLGEIDLCGETVGQVVPRKGGKGFLVSTSRHVVKIVPEENGSQAVNVMKFEHNVLGMGVLQGDGGYQEEEEVVVVTEREVFLVCCMDGQHDANMEPLLIPSSINDRIINFSVDPTGKSVSVSTSALEILCWTRGMPRGAMVDSHVLLAGYENLPTHMHWCHSGKYLVTSDGKDCIIWDVGARKGQCLDDAMVCCSQSKDISDVSCHEGSHTLVRNSFFHVFELRVT